MMKYICISIENKIWNESSWNENNCLSGQMMKSASFNLKQKKTMFQIWLTDETRGKHAIVMKCCNP